MRKDGWPGPRERWTPVSNMSVPISLLFLSLSLSLSPVAMPCAILPFGTVGVHDMPLIIIS